MRWLIAACCLLCLPLLQAAPNRLVHPDDQVAKVLVLKSERRLHLLDRRGSTLKSYQISLGKKPEGTKLREGDQRTPEGVYWIDWRKTSDKYNLSMHISYPNAQDLSRSSRAGVTPGGMIMLHGTPLNDEYPEWFFHSLDWTNGCIALKNQDMREIWHLVEDGTLIEIRP